MSSTDEALTAKLSRVQSAVSKKDLSEIAKCLDNLYLLLVNERDPESWKAYCDANGKVESVVTKILQLCGSHRKAQDPLHEKLAESLAKFLSADDISDAIFVTKRVVQELFDNLLIADSFVRSRMRLARTLVEFACSKAGKQALSGLIETDFDFRDALGDCFNGLSFCDNIAVQISVVEFAWRLIRFSEKERCHSVKKAITTALPEPLDSKVLTILEEDFLNDARDALMIFNRDSADLGRGNPHLCHFECDKIYAQIDDKVEHEISCEVAYLDIGNASLAVAFPPNPDLASSSPQKTFRDLEKENAMTHTFVIEFSAILKVIVVPSVQSVKLYVDPSAVEMIFNQLPRLLRPSSGQPVIFRCVIEGDISVTKECAGKLKSVLKDADVAFSEVSQQKTDKVHVAVMDLAVPSRVPEANGSDMLDEDNALYRSSPLGTTSNNKSVQSLPGQKRVSVASTLFAIPVEEDSEATENPPTRTRRKVSKANSAVENRGDGKQTKTIRRRTYGGKKTDSAAKKASSEGDDEPNEPVDGSSDRPTTRKNLRAENVATSGGRRPVRSKRLFRRGKPADSEQLSGTKKQGHKADDLEVADSPVERRVPERGVSAQKRPRAQTKTSPPNKRLRTIRRRSEAKKPAPRKCKDDSKEIENQAKPRREASSAGEKKEKEPSGLAKRQRSSKRTTETKMYGSGRKQKTTSPWSIFDGGSASPATPPKTYQTTSRSSTRGTISKNPNSAKIPEHQNSPKLDVKKEHVGNRRRVFGSTRKSSESNSTTSAHKSAPKRSRQLKKPSDGQDVISLEVQDREVTPTKPSGAQPVDAEQKRTYTRRKLSSKVSKGGDEQQQSSRTTNEQGPSKSEKPSAALRRRLQLRSAKKAVRDNADEATSKKNDNENRGKVQDSNKRPAERSLVSLRSQKLRKTTKTPEERVSQVTTPSTRSSRSGNGKDSKRAQGKNRDSQGEDGGLDKASAAEKVTAEPLRRSLRRGSSSRRRSTENAVSTNDKSESPEPFSYSPPASESQGSQDGRQSDDGCSVIVKTPSASTGIENILTDSDVSADRLFGNLTPDLTFKAKKRTTMAKIPSLSLAKIKSPIQAPKGSSGLDQLVQAMTKPTKVSKLENSITNSSSIDLDGADDDNLMQMLLLQLLDAKRKKKIRKRKKQLARAQQSMLLDVEEKLGAWENGVEKQLRGTLKAEITRKLAEVSTQIEGLKDRAAAERERQENERKSIHEKIRRYSSALKKALRDVDAFITDCGSAKSEFAHSAQGVRRARGGRQS